MVTCGYRLQLMLLLIHVKEFKKVKYHVKSDDHTKFEQELSAYGLEKSVSLNKFDYRWEI